MGVGKDIVCAERAKSDRKMDRPIVQWVADADRSRRERRDGSGFVNPFAKFFARFEARCPVGGAIRERNLA